MAESVYRAGRGGLGRLSAVLVGGVQSVGAAGICVLRIGLPIDGRKKIWALLDEPNKTFVS
jgi:hypothetical protein